MTEIAPANTPVKIAGNGVKTVVAITPDATPPAKLADAMCLMLKRRSLWTSCEKRKVATVEPIRARKVFKTARFCSADVTEKMELNDGQKAHKKTVPTKLKMSEW